jgi:hypothetical protein
VAINPRTSKLRRFWRRGDDTGSRVAKSGSEPDDRRRTYECVFVDHHWLSRTGRDSTNITEVYVPMSKNRTAGQTEIGSTKFNLSQILVAPLWMSPPLSEEWWLALFIPQAIGGLIGLDYWMVARWPIFLAGLRRSWLDRNCKPRRCDTRYDLLPHQQLVASVV